MTTTPAPKPPPAPVTVWAVVVLLLGLLALIGWFGYLFFAPINCVLG